MGIAILVALILLYVFVGKKSYSKGWEAGEKFSEHIGLKKGREQ